MSDGWVRDYLMQVSPQPAGAAQVGTAQLGSAISQHGSTGTLTQTVLGTQRVSLQATVRQTTRVRFSMWVSQTVLQVVNGT